jgi:hypothetical protein
MSYRKDGDQSERNDSNPSFLHCLLVVISGPIGLLAVGAAMTGGGWLLGLVGIILFLGSMYKWHQAIAGYYSG